MLQGEGSQPARRPEPWLYQLYCCTSCTSTSVFLMYLMYQDTLENHMRGQWYIKYINNNCQKVDVPAVPNVLLYCCTRHQAADRHRRSALSPYPTSCLALCAKSVQPNPSVHVCRIVEPVQPDQIC